MLGLKSLKNENDPTSNRNSVLLTPTNSKVKRVVVKRRVIKHDHKNPQEDD
jgi:hypothetical protein